MSNREGKMNGKAGLLLLAFVGLLFVNSEARTCPSVTLFGPQEILPGAKSWIEKIFFGFYLRMDGNWMVVGGYGQQSHKGAAFMYEKIGQQPNASWKFRQEIRAVNRGKGDYYGLSVGISGLTTVVGSPFDEPYGTRSGSASVYYYDGNSWVHQQFLVAPGNGEGHSYAYYGYAVTNEDNVLLVGARYQNKYENGRYVFGRSGAVYVYSRAGPAGTNYSLDQILRGPNEVSFWADEIRMTGIRSGTGDPRILVGAPRHSPDTYGAAYLFELIGGQWTQTQVLVPNQDGVESGSTSPHFGEGIAMTADTIVVGGEKGASPKGSKTGSAYTFVKVNGSWSQNGPLYPPRGSFHAQRAGVDGDLAAIGQWGSTAKSVSKAGSFAYYVKCDDGSWSTGPWLTLDDPGQGDKLGRMIDVKDGFILVAAPFRNSGTNADAVSRGAVYAYQYVIGDAPVDKNTISFGSPPANLPVCAGGVVSCGDISYAAKTESAVGCTLRSSTGSVLRKAFTDPGSPVTGVGSISSITFALPKSVQVGQTLELRLEMRNPDGTTPTKAKASAQVFAVTC